MTAAGTGTALLLLVALLLVLTTLAARIRPDGRRPAVLRVPAAASGRRQTGR